MFFSSLKDLIIQFAGVGINSSLRYHIRIIRKTRSNLRFVFSTAHVLPFFRKEHKKNHRPASFRNCNQDLVINLQVSAPVKIQGILNISGAVISTTKISNRFNSKIGRKITEKHLPTPRSATVGLSIHL